MFSDITTDFPMQNIIDDNRHVLDGSELSRESLAYMIQIPDEYIGGFLYTWVNGAGVAGAAVCLFGPGIGDEPIFEHCDGMAVDADMDFYDWRVKGLHVQLKEALKTVHVSYKSEKVNIEYAFEGLQPAYGYNTHPNGCPQWIANNRFEQQGVAQGELMLEGRKILFDGFAQRDHSWGTREWGVNQHWKWLHAQSGPDLGVHFWELFALGEKTLYGYVLKDGHMAQVTEVITTLNYDNSMQTEALSALVIDSTGRRTEVKAEAYGVFPFEVDPMITLFEAPLNLTIDGHKGGGWLESQWPNDLINYMKKKTQ